MAEEGSPVFQLRENVTLTSNHLEYSWVNPIQVWASGTVDVSKGKVRIKADAVWQKQLRQSRRSYTGRVCGNCHRGLCSAEVLGTT